jgi:hypothetical protein
MSAVLTGGAGLHPATTAFACVEAAFHVLLLLTATPSPVRIQKYLVASVATAAGAVRSIMTLFFPDDCSRHCDIDHLVCHQQ